MTFWPTLTKKKEPDTSIILYRKTPLLEQLESD